MRLQAYVRVKADTYWVDVVTVDCCIELIVFKCAFNEGKKVYKSYDDSRSMLNHIGSCSDIYTAKFNKWSEAEAHFDKLVKEPEKFIR